MAGRPMKDIPADAHPALADFVRDLRSLIARMLGPGVPVSRLADSTTLSRSTLMHALSGQRLPTLNTVREIVDGLAIHRDLPPDAYRHFLVTWIRKWERTRDAVSSEGSVEAPPPRTQLHGDNVVQYFHGTVDASGAVFGIAAEGTDTGRIPAKDEEGDTVVADAVAALDSALQRMEQATQDVMFARAFLQKAIEADVAKRQAADHTAAEQDCAPLRTGDPKIDAVIREAHQPMPLDQDDVPEQESGGSSLEGR